MQKLDALVLVGFTHCATARELQKAYSMFFSQELRKDISLAAMCVMLRRLTDKQFLKCTKAKRQDVVKYTIGGKSPLRVGTRMYSLTPKGKGEILTLFNLIKIYMLSDEYSKTP